MCISIKLDEIKGRISKSAADAGRRPDEISLIAVSKMFDSERIRLAIDSGQLEFGENRVQESLSKWPALKSQYSDVNLHLLGPLQSNKAPEAVSLFDVIHSVDREKIAGILAKEMEKQGRRIKLLVQVNTGEEPQKAGVFPKESDEFILRCRNEFGLDISGLMCIPPLNENPGPHFGLLRKIAERNDLKELSMGMSADFETAIGFGATYVRIGTGIFGDRRVAT